MRRASCAVSAVVVLAAGILIFRSCGTTADDARAQDCRATKGLRSLAIEYSAQSGDEADTTLLFIERRLAALHGGADIKDPDVQQAVFNIDSTVHDKDAAGLLSAGYGLQDACRAG
ncbi:hypothetical protein [Streptomyces beijiangensis]|uniref:Lipoprotein n=1 Tax=Streptomyces beijiangensis TaxID=163361 RepID=A0A939F5Z5_9ACTN|nr:hypothetical protein [Streptomyces beijiangensis]MBO0512518.1 hypothetical protein [Streptomyces beijiangensis]